jgi:hypothetical protein
MGARITGRRALVAALVVLLVGSAVAGGMWWSATGHPPSDASKTLVATITTPVLPSELGVGTQECLDRIGTADRWLDLCWAVNRAPDGDPTQDYYWLRLYGSLHADSPNSGLHWMVLRTEPTAGGPRFWIGHTTPDWNYDGGCTEMAVTGIAAPMGGVPQAVDVCGLTIVDDSGVGMGKFTLTWACQHCLLAMSGTQGVELIEELITPEGSLPVLDLYADIG